MVYWVMLKTDAPGWQCLGLYKTKRGALRKAEAHRDQGRVMVTELQPYGTTVYDTAPND